MVFHSVYFSESVTDFSHVYDVFGIISVLQDKSSFHILFLYNRIYQGKAKIFIIEKHDTKYLVSCMCLFSIHILIGICSEWQITQSLILVSNIAIIAVNDESTIINLLPEQFI